ncbi:MAG: alpha/beta-hydrolase family protein [Ornithinimicrobium sp.]
MSRPHQGEPSGRVSVALLCASSTAVVAFWLSLTPSLIPRPAEFSGVVAAVAALLGYAFGSLLVAGYRFFLERPAEATVRAVWLLLPLLVGVVGTAIVLRQYWGWQDQLRDLMGMSGLGRGHVPILLAVGAGTFALLFLVSRLVRWLFRLVSRPVARVVPRRVAALVAVVALAVLSISLLNGVVRDEVLQGLDRTFATINEEDVPDFSQPGLPELSGGPQSLVTWESLGREGRIFVADAATVEELEAFGTASPVQPVRAYVGVASAETIAAEADLAVRELERQGGFDRAVISVITTTGTGWVNENASLALEYIYGGDTAQVSMQYSYLPSPLSFLIDQGRAQAAGRALFDAVYERWEQLPPEDRPRLVVAGESLGSFGGESAFSGVGDLRARVDGALFVGPPFMNDLWRDFTDGRDAGSPERLPAFEQGRTVRFVADPQDLRRPDAPWPEPRVVYLQYPSDPITWWSPQLFIQRPDWLEEPRGQDVLPSTRWIPAVTFLQLTADMALSTEVPPGHGHRFGSDPANAWAAILQPAGWTERDTDRLRLILEPEHP